MIEKIQKTSWKTTLAGVLAAIAFASSELEAAFSGDEADWGQIASALTIALMAFFARDNDKTSESVGAKVE